MNRKAIFFWATLLAVAAGFAAAAAFLFPYDSLRLTTQPERWRAWLLTLWTGGVMSVLFGVSALVGYISPVGFREVHEAGSVTKALEARKQLRRDQHGFHQNFAWWLTCLGGVLIALYFVVWRLNGSFSL